MKTQLSTTTQTEVQRCDISGPPSFDPYARGASTTGDYYSAASDQMHSNMKTASGSTEYQTAVSSAQNARCLAQNAQCYLIVTTNYGHWPLARKGRQFREGT